MMTPDSPHSIGTLILAAGHSRRMGSKNKLLLPLREKPILQHVIDAALASNITQTIVVTGHEHERVEALASDDRLTYLYNPRFSEGLSTSLVKGIQSLEKKRVDGALILLGDMPDITHEHINYILSFFRNQSSICVPFFKANRGNPILWGRQHFAHLKTLTGDQGARALLADHQDTLIPVSMDDRRNGNAVLNDIDKPEDLA